MDVLKINDDDDDDDDDILYPREVQDLGDTEVKVLVMVKSGEHHKDLGTSKDCIFYLITNYYYYYYYYYYRMLFKKCLKSC